MQENPNFEKHAGQISLSWKSQIAGIKKCHTKLLPDKFQEKTQSLVALASILETLLTFDGTMLCVFYLITVNSIINDNNCHYYQTQPSPVPKLETLLTFDGTMLCVFYLITVNSIINDNNCHYYQTQPSPVPKSRQDMGTGVRR